MRRARLPLLLAFLSCAPAGAQAAEFYAYRATVSLTLRSATSESGVDRLSTVRLSSKRLINAIRGQPLERAVPPNLALVVVMRKDLSTYFGSGLGILDRETNAFTRIATVSTLGTLSADDPDAPTVGAGEASVIGMPLAGGPGGDLYLDGFAIRGGGRGALAQKGDGAALSLEVSGLHGRFYRYPPPPDPMPPYPASVVAEGRLRASGKPLATLDL